MQLRSFLSYTLTSVTRVRHRPTDSKLAHMQRPRSLQRGLCLLIIWFTLRDVKSTLQLYVTCFGVSHRHQATQLFQDHNRPCNAIERRRQRPRLRRRLTTKIDTTGAWMAWNDWASRTEIIQNDDDLTWQGIKRIRPSTPLLYSAVTPTKPQNRTSDALTSRIRVQKKRPFFSVIDQNDVL